MQRLANLVVASQPLPTTTNHCLSVCRQTLDHSAFTNEGGRQGALEGLIAQVIDSPVQGVGGVYDADGDILLSDNWDDYLDMSL